MHFLPFDLTTWALNNTFPKPCIVPTFTESCFTQCVKPYLFIGKIRMVQTSVYQENFLPPFIQGKFHQLLLFETVNAPTGDAHFDHSSLENVETASRYRASH